MKNHRPSKDSYYLGIARQVGMRSTCYRNKMGALIVRGDQIVSTGYIGAPRKTKDCFEREECLRDKLGIPHGHRYEVCRSVHAEQNAIINAARAGVSLFGGDMFLYLESAKTSQPLDAFPCFLCKRAIINAGLDRFVCSTKDGGVKVFKVTDWVNDWQKKDIVDDEYKYGDGRAVDK